MIPAPYLVQIILSWTEALLNGRIWVGKTLFDDIDKSLNMVDNRRLQDSVARAGRSNFEASLFKADLEVERRLQARSAAGCRWFHRVTHFTSGSLRCA